MNKQKSGWECKHYEREVQIKGGSGYYYDIIGDTIWLCRMCEKKLRQEILEQSKLEHTLKDINVKLKRKKKK